MFEVEIKFEVDGAKAKGIVRGKHKVSETQQIDEYFDFSDLALYKKHAFLRIRDHKKLNWKAYPAKDSIIATEIAFDFEKQNVDALHSIADFLKVDKFDGKADEESLKRWLLKNGLKPLIVLDKKRAVFQDENYVYAVDDVRGLGKYMEIEKETEDKSETEKIKDDLKRFANEIGVKTIDEKGYVQLYVEKYYPHLLR